MQRAARRTGIPIGQAEAVGVDRVFKVGIEARLRPREVLGELHEPRVGLGIDGVVQFELLEPTEARALGDQSPGVELQPIELRPHSGAVRIKRERSPYRLACAEKVARRFHSRADVNVLEVGVLIESEENKQQKRAGDGEGAQCIRSLFLWARRLEGDIETALFELEDGGLDDRKADLQPGRHERLREAVD